MTSLTLVSPALGLCGTDTVKASHIRLLAKPTTDKDVQEVLRFTRSKDLAHGAFVELMNHLAVTIYCGLLGVRLKLAVALKLLQAKLATPLVNNGHVATAGRG